MDRQVGGMWWLASVDDRRRPQCRSRRWVVGGCRKTPRVVAAVRPQVARRGPQPPADHHPDPRVVQLRARLHPRTAALRHVEDSAVRTHRRLPLLARISSRILARVP